MRWENLNKSYLDFNAKMFNEFKGDNFEALEHDKTALKLFLDEVQHNTKKWDSPIERLVWMIKKDYYIDFFEKYSVKDINTIIYRIKSFNFQFQSYMACSKFYKSYALKDDSTGEYLETYEDRILCNVLDLANGDMLKALFYTNEIMSQRLQPATPTFLNAGRKRRGEFVSCFLLDIDDSTNSIEHVTGMCAQLSRIGGGVAFNVSKIRSRGETIKGIPNASSGVVPVLKKMEATFSLYNQLKQRDGAGAGYLNIFHADLEEFLSTKRINADEKVRLATLSIGLIIPSKFMDIARNNEPFFVFQPLTVYKTYGEYLDRMDMDKMYNILVNDKRIGKKRLDAREILNLIATLQLESGYPYIMYKDNANKHHALKEIGTVEFSNLCTEIMQLSETSIINDYNVPDIIKRDISCNLASLNIINIMEQKSLSNSVIIGMYMLTEVSDRTNIQNAPSVKKANDELHSVGLGAMNLHGFLAKNQIRYGSELAHEFLDVFFSAMNYWSIVASMNIAREREETFKDFDKSEYANGDYFDMYLKYDFLPVSVPMKRIFSGMEDQLPTREMWQQLKEDVAKYGLYHTYRLAIAPTQSISYVQNSTSSVMPITQLIERRSYGDKEDYYPMPFLSPKTYWFYQSAFNMDQKLVIDTVATIQKHIDQGISCTLFVNDTIPTNELVKLYAYAHYKGLKSLYYTRTNLTGAGNECVSCSI